MFQRLRRWSIGIIILLAGIGAFAAPLTAGKLDYVASFIQPDIRFDLCTMVAADGSGAKTALLGMRAAKVSNSFAFASDEWPTLIDLVRTAANQQFQTNGWVVVGEVTETHTTDISHLVISSGPGIRFALNSPAGASLTVILPSNDVPRLQQALQQIQAFFQTP